MHSYEVGLMIDLMIKPTRTGLSINISRTGDKLPMQRGFSKNGMGDLLLVLRFLGGLYNFCNFAISPSKLPQHYIVVQGRAQLEYGSHIVTVGVEATC